MNTKDLHPLTDDAPIEVFNPSTGMNVLITDETLPKIIKEQIQGIKDISQKVEDCTLKAQNLKEGATKLKEDGVSAFHKKDAIKALQELAKDSTELQDDFAQNQKCLFENQKQLSQALKFVFAISVTSLARTTQTIHILKAELEGASKEELSEMERQELQGLLDQLQAQEALRTKLEKHDTWFAELDKKKQDKIDNLDEIKANAALGATAVQPETLKPYVKTDDSRLTDARPASDVSAWAKAKDKPSYTAKEIGALSKDTKISEIDGFSEEHQRLESKQDKINDLEKIRSGATLGATAIQKHQDVSGKQDIIADLDSIRRGATLGATSIQEHQDISGKADISFVEEQLQCSKDNLNQEVTTLQQTLQKAQDDLQKEHQRYEKLKKALIATSICIGTISVGALIALLILIL